MKLSGKEAFVGIAGAALLYVFLKAASPAVLDRIFGQVPDGVCHALSLDCSAEK